jgi:CDP-diacylglycerol--serine O-phosphatidyltransferase
MSLEVEQRKSHRGIYLLPNLFTTAALFAGFYAIVASMGGRFEAAAITVFIAMLLDGLDGRVARITNTSSEFGAEYDSLSDMVSFGLAPSLVMYEWALVHMKDMGWVWAKLGWLAAFFYAAAAALRLARFNIRTSSLDKRYFQGLPSPSAAALLMGMIWVWNDLDYSGDDLKIPAFVLTIVAGALMVSRISYYSFKDFDPRNRIPFIALLAIVLAFMLTSIDPPKILFGAFALYALSGPLLNIVRWKRKRIRSHKTLAGAGDNPDK